MTFVKLRKVIAFVTALVIAMGLVAVWVPATDVSAEGRVDGAGMTVSNGNLHTMAIRADGSLWAWGANSDGRLGDGTITNRHTPVRIMDNVSTVSSSNSHTMAIRTDGSLWAWGWNNFGQLGDGTTTNRHSPVRIMENVSAVSAGHFHTMAIRTDGSLWAWGWNEYGQFGDGTTTDRHSPVRIKDSVMQPRGMQLLNHPIIGSWELVITRNMSEYMVSDITIFNANETGVGIFHQDGLAIPFDWHIIRPGWVYISGSGEVEYEISGDDARFIFDRAANAYSVVRRMDIDDEAVAPPPVPLNAPSIGSTINFGDYTWRVLDVEGNRALIITENVIFRRGYDPMGASWENSDIRRYLNNVFFNRFSPQDQARIATTYVINNNNPWSGMRGGNNTTDSVFLLSIEEVVRYFGDSGQLNNRPRNMSIITDEYNEARVARDLEGQASWWWLRSPGNGFVGAYVFFDGAIAVINPNVFGILPGGSVRPALWLYIN